jgi:hypothetical protein
MNKKVKPPRSQTLQEFINPIHAQEWVNRGQMIQYVRLAFDLYRHAERERRWWRRTWRWFRRLWLRPEVA